MVNLIQGFDIVNYQSGRCIHDIPYAFALGFHRVTITFAFNLEYIANLPVRVQHIYSLSLVIKLGYICFTHYLNGNITCTSLNIPCA